MTLIVARRRLVTAVVVISATAIAMFSCRPVHYGDPPAVPAPATQAAPATAPDRGAGQTPTRPSTGTSSASPRTRTPNAAPVSMPAAPEVPHEFRGVWVASVANIDWPSKRTLTTAQQQQELLALFDRAAALHLNAVIFQIRPAADALYASKIEPWSEYLTGAQGRAPDPWWDPLEFAIKAAHERNMELHAWFNPYRARHTDAKSPLDKSHIARTNPALVKTYAGYLWMDPGEAAVRARTLSVVLDVVKRYDVDGIHIDDYFYPYPENTRRGQPIPFPDDASWKQYQTSGGKLNRADWRRNNVDLLVEQLHNGIHAAKPWVKFGISPFGIWRPGYPEQIRGLDAYEKLYADARKWLHKGWLDYFTPQLYWPTTKTAQAYSVLLEWWAQENTMARHLWPGNFTSRAAGAGASAFPVSELVEQIRVTRLQPGATGNVHFSMKAFLINQGGMNDFLNQGPYASMALIPATPWLTAPPPPVPSIQLQVLRGQTMMTLGTTNQVAPWQWIVQLRNGTGWTTTLLRGTITSVPIERNLGATQVSVRTVNRLGVMSPAISVSVASDAAGGRDAPANTQSSPAQTPVGGRPRDH